jgi:ATP-dependent RNA helicase RhlE
MSFESLGLSPALVRATTERGYASPTSIQAAAIPAVLRGVDVIAAAQTGSGKTAAFALPLLQQLEDQLLPPQRRAKRTTHALVLVPTRELAVQVAETFVALARHGWRAARVVAVFGGVSINPQMMALRGGAEVVVATPGRLLDLLSHNALQLDQLAVLVLDEADRLLDAGFADELARILAVLPARRQGLLFSATFPPAVQALADGLLQAPVRVEGAAGPVVQITQRALQVDVARRTPLLRHLIAQAGWSRVLVFVASRYGSEHVAGKLSSAGIAAAALHGELGQGARRQVLADFKAGALQVLVATDLAARGLDITRLPVVVNYDLPRAAADYVHRIGRTGRAGEDGLALSFVPAEAEAHFRLIEKRQGQQVPREQIAGFEPAAVVAPAPAGTGGIKGRRKSKKDKLREAAARGG